MCSISLVLVSLCSFEGEWMNDASLRLHSNLHPGLLVAQGRKTKEEEAKADAAALKSYLEKNHVGRKWQVGPTVLDSEEIRKAYGNQRFCFVHSSPPLPPGANIKELIEAHQKRMAEFEKTMISLTVAFNEKDEIRPISKPEAFRVGLMKVASDEDARIAAAAALSLLGSGMVSPGVVSAKEVNVTKTAKGWSCTVNRANAFSGFVEFDVQGTLTVVNKSYAGPVPP